jgi:acetyl esterase/lipase
MDIFEPKGQANGATVVWIVSGGWLSRHSDIKPDHPAAPVRRLTEKGYRVCAVVHGSRPLFTVEDAISDVQRAIRYARYTAQNDGATSVPVGVIGASAGGHLSLMAGMAGDTGVSESDDPVEQTSSRIQAVACYFPPTDFLNYGAPHVNSLETDIGEQFAAPFQFRRHNEETRTLEPVADPKEKLKLMEEVAPINHISPDDPPVRIIHGDKDKIVPIQQSEIFIEKLQQTGVKHDLIRRPGAGHGWLTIAADNELLFDWLDEHLIQRN